MNEALDVKVLRSAMKAQGFNQKQLVDISGVSRPQLSRLLAHKTKTVRQSTVQKLAEALKIGPTELIVGGGLHDFRDSLANEHQKLDFRGIGMPQFERQPIEDVFVDMTVCENVGSSDDCQPGSADVEKRRLSQPLSATECLQTQDRVVVVGHPGSGKTTLLRYLTYTYATHKGRNAELPLYIRLPEFCRALEIDERVDFVKFVVSKAAEHGCPNIESTLRNELEREPKKGEPGKCLILLDGLDEVGDREQRERLIAAIDAFVKQYPKNRFVVTSRIMGFKAGSWTALGFSVFRISGYNRKQLRTFSEKWATLLSRIQGQPYSEVLGDLETAIFSNPRVRALASNPLILTILVLLSGARGGTLPRRRVDLYQKVVDVFLDSWEKSKRATEKFDETYSINLDAREFRWLLSDVSLAMQKANRTLAPRWWLAARMREYLQDKLGFESEEANDTCDRIIRYLAERTGLIEERGLNLFGFSHRTLQEYFAALGVIDEADASHARNVTDCLRGYFFHPQWCEVVRLVAAQLTPPLAESLILTILDDPDPVGRFLKRGPLLVLRCLADGTTIANRKILANVFDALVDLGRSKWLGITLEAFDLLESLDGTRLENQAKDAMTATLSIAQSELDSHDYGCLYGRVKLSEVLETMIEEQFAGFESEAAREIDVPFNGKTHKVALFNATMLLECPDEWYQSVCSILEDEQQSLQFKQVVVRELGRRVSTDLRSRMRLRKILVSNAQSSLRCGSASALAAATKGRHNTKRLLIRVLQNDPDVKVRAACAMGLDDAAVDDELVRSELVRFFEDTQPAKVRAGAARGLSKAAITDLSLTESLLRCVSDDREPAEIRQSAAWSLEPQIGKREKVLEAFKSWLDAPAAGKLGQIAALCLSTAMADESNDIAWDHRVIEKIEHILMNLSEPCGHALESLEELATAREVRGGLRLETVLAESLKPINENIDVAFIFGSTARNRQMDDSDIDLFIIGETTLKELASPLRRTENTLGRRINPVIYTHESFREKYRAGDPFLLDVYRREKIPIVHTTVDEARRDLNDELRAMVTERLASEV